MEASRTARLAQRGRVEDIQVADVPVVERAALLDVYTDRFGKDADGRIGAAGTS
jgi:hypothetical protein